MADLAHQLKFDHATLFQKPKEPISSLTNKESRVKVIKPPTGANVYTLFRYFESDYIDRFMPRFEDMIRAIGERCPSGVASVEKSKLQMMTMMRSFIRYTMLAVLSVDERGDRLSEMIGKFNALYFEYDDKLVPLAKNDYKHIDKLHSLIIQTYNESLDMKTDNFYKHCSAEKNRGRTPTHIKNNPPHPVNRIKQEYILATRTNPPVKYDEEDNEFFMDRLGPVSPSGNAQRDVDFYPVFLKVLSVFRDTIPQQTNHGWFLERLRGGVRKLTPADWPMHGLVNSLLNMEGLIEKKRVRITKSRHNRRYYCSYSGLPLEEDEEVWLIRILVQSSARYKTWFKDGKIPVEPHNSPLLRGDIKNYFIKTSLCSTQQLFYTDFPSDYKCRYPEYFGLKRTPKMSRTLPEDRVYQYNTLWYTMNRLILFIEENKMYNMLWHEKESMLLFVNRVTATLLTLEQEDNFQENLLRFILQAIFRVDDIEVLPQHILNDRPMLDTYLKHMLSIVIDFIDLMFDYSLPFNSGNNISGGSTHNNNTKESVKSYFFNLPLLGIVESEEDMKNILVVKPVLRIPIEEDGLLNNLFHLSRKRKEQLGTHLMQMPFNEIQARIRRLEQSIKTHPFMFILFYNRLYLGLTSLPPMNFMEANKILCHLSITLSNQ